MPAPVAVPPALAVPLRYGDDEERPAVSLQRPANDRLAVPAPGPVDERAPATAAVAPLPMDDPPAAGAELPVAADRLGPDLSDDLLGAAERGPLFRRVGRDDARPAAPRPCGRVERKQPKLRDCRRHDSRAPFRDAFVSRWTMRRSSAGSSGSGAAAGSRPNEPSSPSSENTGSNPVRAFERSDPRGRRAVPHLLAHRPVLDRVAFDLGLELGELERDSESADDVPGGRDDPSGAHDRGDCREDAPDLLGSRCRSRWPRRGSAGTRPGAHPPRRARRCA